MDRIWLFCSVALAPEALKQREQVRCTLWLSSYELGRRKVSIEKNKAIVRRLWEEVWNQNDLGVCDEIVDAAYAEENKDWAPVTKTAFPDLHFTIEDMIAEIDKVVSRLTLTGTHQGDSRGVAATGNPFMIACTWIHRLAEYRIVEAREWGEWDTLGMMVHLGAV